MKSHIFFYIFITMTLLNSCASKKDFELKSETLRTNALEYLKSFQDGIPNPEKFIDKKFITHTTPNSNGIQNAGQHILQQSPTGTVKIEVLRSFVDEKYVVVHSIYHLPKPLVVFDVFLFNNNGLIIGNWHNASLFRNQKNPSQHTQIDGPTKVIDRQHTIKNKQLVHSFTKNILIAMKINNIPQYFDGNTYIQHSPFVGDGVSNLRNFLAEYQDKDNLPQFGMYYENIILLLGEGNFVLVASQGRDGGDAYRFFDLFNIKNNKIHEHWSTVQKIETQ